MWRRGISLGTTDPITEPVPDARESGAALVVVLLLGALFVALGTSAAVLADVETLVASNHRDSLVVRHAAEGAADVVVQELAQVADWTPALSGSVSSVLAGALVLPRSSGGGVVDAPTLTATLQQATYGGGAWGADTPRWRLFAHGNPGVDLPFPGLSDQVYVLVWLSDDIAETDADPSVDTNDTVVVRARASGPRRSQCDVQLVITRTSPGVVRRVSSRVIR
jgi:hypothetical protein